MGHKSAKAPSTPVAAPTFYHASDRVSPGLFVWLPVVGGAGAVVLGTVYAFVAYFCHVIGKPMWLIVVTPLFAATLGPLGQGVCQLGKVRRRSVRRWVVYAVTAMVLYWAWHAYLNFGREEVSPLRPTWHMSPLMLVRAMGTMAQERGMLVVVVWLIEAATIFGVVAWGMRGLNPEMPFCETCEQWATDRFRLQYEDGNLGPILDAFRAGRADGLAGLGRWSGVGDLHVQVRVMECPCTASRHVTIERVKVTRGRRGRGLELQSRRSRRSGWVLNYDIGTFDESEATPVLENMKLARPLWDELERLHKRQQEQDDRAEEAEANKDD